LDNAPTTEEVPSVDPNDEQNNDSPPTTTTEQLAPPAQSTPSPESQTDPAPWGVDQAPTDTTSPNNPSSNNNNNSNNNGVGNGGVGSASTIKNMVDQKTKTSTSKQTLVGRIVMLLMVLVVGAIFGVLLAIEGLRRQRQQSPHMHFDQTADMLDPRNPAAGDDDDQNYFSYRPRAWSQIDKQETFYTEPMIDVEII